MKSSNEMVQSLLERRDIYEAEKTQKRMRNMRITASVCCVCLVATVGFGLWHGGAFENEPAETLEDSVIPGMKDWYGPGEEEPTYGPVGNTAVEAPDTVNVNKIDAISSAEGSLFALIMDDFIEMDSAELNEYYGASIFGMAEGGWAEKPEGGGIYRRDGGEGELYWDFNTVTYTSDDSAKTVFIMATKGTKNYAVSLFEFIKDGERSEIGGVEVAIGVTDDGQHQADFYFGESAIRVITSGLSEDELVEVIRSIIK